MKLLEVGKLERIDDEMLEAIIECVQDRVEDVESREPWDCEGSYYEKWCEKLDDLQDIQSDLEYMRDMDHEERLQKLKKISMNLIYHQFTYVGLKRLKIYK